MKLLGKLVLFLVVVIAVVFLARNHIVKAAAESGVQGMTGMPLKIGKLDIDFSKTLVDVEDIAMKNPPGFHGSAFLDVPKILVDYNLSDILKGKVHLENLELDLKQFTVVKNEKGQLNLDSLKQVQGTQKTPTGAGKPAPQAPAKPVPVQIDRMHLKIGKVVYMDYSGATPVTKEYNIGLDETYQNITDRNSIMRIIVLKAMMSSGLSNLVNFDVQGLSSALTGAFSGSAGMATKLASQTAAQVETQAKGAIATTTNAVTGAVGSLKDKLKLPFGKSES